ncbi:hypothetical protein AAG906_028039 [Vitis piasezkii]
MEDRMKEKGVLKLVHPGRFVEIHTEPITAAEVLRKNPRHSITRPDVFRNPWVVVQPEAVLMPGRVFFIVPNQTIYRLLKASGHCQQSAPLPQYDSPKATHDLCWFPKQISPLRAWAGITPKHQNPKQILQHQVRTMPRNGVMSSWDQDSDKNLRGHSLVEPWGREFGKHRHSHQEFEQEPLLESMGETTSYHAEENSSMINNCNVSQPKTKEGELKYRRRKQATMLKSCLRKQDSVRKALSPRVTFFLPNKDDKKCERYSVSKRICVLHCF